MAKTGINAGKLDKQNQQSQCEKCTLFFMFGHLLNYIYHSTIHSQYGSKCKQT